MQLDQFQLIDRIIEIDGLNRTIRTEAQIPASHSIFSGHFPGYPLMPGVLLVEAMAQTAGWLVIALTRFERMAFLAAIKEAKLRKFVTPGDQLSLKAGIVHEGSGYFVTTAKVEASGTPVCDATLTFRLTPFPNSELQASMRDAAARLSFPIEALG